jgi:hypothetical protein
MNRCGREFDDELIQQFNVLAEFVAAGGFCERESPGIRGERLSRGRGHAEERLGGGYLGGERDRDAFSSLRQAR